MSLIITVVRVSRPAASRSRLMRLASGIWSFLSRCMIRWAEEVTEVESVLDSREREAGPAGVASKELMSCGRKTSR